MGGLHFGRRPMERLAGCGRKIDSVICTHCLEFVGDPDFVLKEINQAAASSLVSRSATSLGLSPRPMPDPMGQACMIKSLTDTTL